MNRQQRRAAARRSPISAGNAPRKTGTIAVPPGVDDVLQAGMAHHRAGRLAQAEVDYRRVLAVAPDHADALHLLGVIACQAGRHEAAIELIGRAIQQKGDEFSYHNSYGIVLQRVERLDEAVASYDRALALKPDYAEALNNRGATLHKLERYAEAVQSFDRALAIKPDYAEALSNRGNTLQALGGFGEALESYDRALAGRPEFALRQFNRSTLLLLTGHFAEGWQGYERRRKLHFARSLSGPEWSGGDSVGKRLLFYSEQGLGDTIQFSRFACLIAAKARQVFLEVQPALASLLSRLEGVTVIRNGDALPEYDAHLPLMSLPRVLGVTPETMSANVPYLSAEPVRIEGWGRRLPAAGFRIGIVWQGNPRVKHGRGARSIPLRAFAPLCRIPGLTLISLQKGYGVEQLADLPLGMRVETLGDDFDAGPDAFLDTAAVMMNLDLVISCDTSSAHLAGALGCPVWIVLRDVPEWRWMMDREDTPWYPTARLFRQAHRGDWNEVLERVAVQLARAVAAKEMPGNRTR
jgi:tetratricopeptide (TPR) repeat protein